MSKLEQAISGFFWLGFIVFLAASIPHVADYFYHFDGSNGGPYAVFISYAIAIVIDTSDVLISITVMKERARGTKTRDLLGYWAFIFFIMVFSWAVNWQYDKVHESTAYAAVDGIALFGTSLTVGTINPILGSSFQVLLFVYTGMAHKFAASHKTAEEIKKEIKRLEEQKEDAIKLRELRKAIKGEEESSIIGETLGRFTALGTKVIEQKLLAPVVVSMPQTVSSLPLESAVQVDQKPPIKQESDTTMITPIMEPIRVQEIPLQIEQVEQQESDLEERETPGEIQVVNVTQTEQKTTKITRELPPVSEQIETAKSQDENTGYTQEEVVNDDRVKMLFKRFDTRKKAVEDAINSKALPLRKGRISETGLKTWVQTVKRSRESAPKAKEKANA